MKPYDTKLQNNESRNFNIKKNNKIKCQNDINIKFSEKKTPYSGIENKKIDKYSNGSEKQLRATVWALIIDLVSI